VGHAAEALLLALLPVMILFQGAAAENPLFADSWVATLWPWWTLCTTLLALRWFYLQSRRQQEVVSSPSLATGIVWSILLVAAYTTGLLAAASTDNPMGVLVDALWPITIGMLLGGSAWWMAAKNRLPAMPVIPPGDLWSILERWLSRSNHWVRSIGLQVLPRWRAAVLAAGGRFLHVRAWQKALDAGERSLQSWTLAVTLLLLLGIVIAIAVG